MGSCWRGTKAKSRVQQRSWPLRPSWNSRPVYGDFCRCSFQGTRGYLFSLPTSCLEITGKSRKADQVLRICTQHFFIQAKEYFYVFSTRVLVCCICTLANPLRLVTVPILLKIFLLSKTYRNTSHWWYMRHGTLAGNPILVSTMLLCLATFCAFKAVLWNWPQIKVWSLQLYKEFCSRNLQKCWHT